MPKHTIVALFCFVLPGLVVGASLQAQVPAKLVPPVGALVNNSDHRIIGGHDASAGQFPYHVYMFFPDGRFCSGSIISPAWILTVAQCILPGTTPAGIHIVAGTHNMIDQGINYGISEIHVHDQFNPGTKENNIALLKVNGQIAYTDYVKRVPLTLLPPLAGASLVLSGYGITEPDGGPSFDAMQYIGLESIGTLDCQQRLPGYTVTVLGNTCTLAPVGQGACQGDSGAPLVTQDGALVGIASFTVVPCADGKPDVFTSVAAYRVWILAITGTLV